MLTDARAPGYIPACITIDMEAVVVIDWSLQGSTLSPFESVNPVH
jgi:hypothetical protein